MIEERALRRARQGTGGAFLLAGILTGVWNTRLPALQDRFGLPTHQIGMVIATWGVAALAAMVALRRSARVPVGSEWRAALGRAVFGVGMLAGRLFGDRLRATASGPDTVPDRQVPCPATVPDALDFGLPAPSMSPAGGDG